ncbi:MAG: mechanosensitive ion channel family protein [Pseudomonadales bacterium]
MATEQLAETIAHWGLPPLAVIGITLLIVWLARRAIPDRSSTRIFRQLAVVGVILAANAVIVLVLPIGSELRGQLLSLFGLVLTAIIALSSTTLVGNAMAGVMLRAVGGFHPGDFISVEGHFGRVTELGLLHTEVQSEDRDLVTLPNLYLISHPVKVVSASGTLVSTDVSLGYDAPRQQVAKALVAGAESAGLGEPFVQIKALLDHAVAYRVSGFLEDVRSLVSKRTELNAAVLDKLHGAGLEIVSPSFVNQRRLDANVSVVPGLDVNQDSDTSTPAASGQPEQMMFDKAEVAGRLTRLQAQRDEVAAQIKAMEQDKSAADAASEIAWRKRQLETLDEVIAAFERD